MSQASRIKIIIWLQKHYVTVYLLLDPSSRRARIRLYTWAIEAAMYCIQAEKLLDHSVLLRTDMQSRTSLLDV